MKSRVAISSLFILIAAMVLASHGAGLLEKLKVLQASFANKISEVRGLPILDHSRTTGNPPRAAGTISPDTQTVTFNFLDTTHFLDSPARHLQRFVLNLIDCDHQGD
jgi:hypothetical protein